MPPHTPTCPKCAYDQSGEIATWKTQCPTKGTCPECGLTFTWANILNPSRIQLPWFIEHAKSKHQLFKRTLPTLWILLIPNRYWHRVTMETPRSIKTYFLWLALLMAILHIFTTATLIAANFGYHYQSNARITQRMSTLTPAQQKQYGYTLTDLTTIDYWKPIIGESLLLPIIQRSNFTERFAEGIATITTVFLGISIMWFLLYCTFSATRKRTKLRIIHVTRAMIVAGFLPMLLIQLGRFVDAALFVGIYWTPFNTIENILFLMVSIGVPLLFIWQVWFWIAATRIGWQINAKWWELVLVTTASLMGISIAAFIMVAFKPIRIAVDHLATWTGI